MSFERRWIRSADLLGLACLTFAALALLDHGAPLALLPDDWALPVFAACFAAALAAFALARCVQIACLVWRAPPPAALRAGDGAAADEGRQRPRAA